MVTWAVALREWCQAESMLVLWPEALPKHVSPRPRYGLYESVVPGIIRTCGLLVSQYQRTLVEVGRLQDIWSPTQTYAWKE